MARFARRAQEPGNRRVVGLFQGPDAPCLASCPGPGEGFCVQALPGNLGAPASGMREGDRPAMFLAVLTTDPQQACKVVAEGVTGG